MLWTCLSLLVVFEQPNDEHALTRDLFLASRKIYQKINQFLPQQIWIKKKQNVCLSYLTANISWNEEFFATNTPCIVVRRNGMMFKLHISCCENVSSIIGNAVFASQWKAYSSFFTKSNPSLFYKYNFSDGLLTSIRFDMKYLTSASCVDFQQYINQR